MDADGFSVMVNVGFRPSGRKSMPQCSSVDIPTWISLPHTLWILALNDDENGVLGSLADSFVVFVGRDDVVVPP